VNLLYQAKVVIAAPVLGNHIETTMAEMKLVVVTNRLQVTIARGTSCNQM